MASLHLLTCLAIILLCLCNLCQSSGITSNKYKKYTDVAPTGTAYNSVSTRSRPECAKSCSKDPKCSTFTIKEVGSVVECESYTCWESTQNTTMTGVNTYTKEVTDPIVCPAGYSRACNHCYLYHDAWMTLDNARDFCTSTHPGAYMAEITSPGENGFVHGMVGFSPWLGGRLLSGTWTWTHSGRNVSAGYENWMPGEPNGPGDCMVMDYGTGQWFDDPCGYPWSVVCEYGN